MKGLRKYLTPFAPDQSGAVSVLYELGGIIVIIDAGGCAGNICGFDEPRWSETRSAVFSAGLRDMDAIMGRDKLLVKKVIEASKKIDSNFIALIGTPVPAVIGTDYKALKRMLYKEVSLPVVTVDSDGMHLFDKGEEKAYLSIIRELKEKDLFIHTDDAVKKEIRRSGVFGATPLDLYSFDAKALIEGSLKACGFNEVVFYGNGASFSDLKSACENAINLAVSPSGIKAVRLLKEYFNTPYEIRFPGTDDLINMRSGSFTFSADKNIDFLNDKTLLDVVSHAKKILIVHSQIFANSLRKAIQKKCDADIFVSSWFSMEEEFMEEGDVRLKEEDDFIALSKQGFDMIIGDEILRKMIPYFQGTFINIPEFYISGKKRAVS